MLFRKNTLSATMTATLVMALSMAPAQADDDTAMAIAGVIALGLLGAAVASDQHDRGHEKYTPHPKLHVDENAVGRCAHRAKRKVKNAGGYNFKVNHVNSVKAEKNGSTHVSFVGTGYYSFGHKTSDIRCVIKNHKVSSFRFD